MAREPKIWDGRGDKLTDARKTEFAGRAADDLRLGVLHLRLLAHFGRQNARRGWLRVSQTELAQAWGYSRQRVNTVIGELVQWGYIRKVEQVRTGESYCYYQTLLDEPFEDAEDEGGVSRIGDAPSQGACSAEGTPRHGGSVKSQATPPQSGECQTTVDTPAEGECQIPVDTCVASHLTPASTPTRHPPYIEHARTDFRRQAPIPPYPQGGIKREFDDLQDVDRLLSRVAAGGVSVEVCERLFRPVLTQRRLSAADRLATLTELGRRAHGLEPEALDRAARDVLEADVKVIKAERLARAIQIAHDAGARVVIRPGTAQWHRWLAHLDQHDPKAAAIARKVGVYQARTTWPVKPKGAAA